MRIDENEKVDIWQIGNTGLRNPLRMQEGFLVFSQSQYVGNLRGKDNEIGFMKLLNEKNIIHNEDGKDESGSYARKWRLMFARYGFIYGKPEKIDGFRQDELGALDEITPYGELFLKLDNVASIQECYLRSLSVEQFWLADKSGHFSPLRWVLAIMLELERRTGSSEFKALEFALWGQTTDPRYDLSEVVDHILDFRTRKELAPSKKRFDKDEIAKRASHYVKKSDNFKEYYDMNIRNLRASGLLLRKGRGIIINPSKHIMVEELAKTTASNEPMIDVFRSLTTGAKLPTDDLVVANRVLSDMEQQLKARHIHYDISDLSLDTASEANIARIRLEEILAQTDEINYAADQKNKWQEISDYMSLLIKGGGKKEYDDDYVIEVPKDETPAYLEWTLWRAALAINHLANMPYEVRGFRLDSDFLPVTAAGGGKGDLYCEYDKYMILTEVTMSTSSRQEAMEGEPVRRHVSDAVLKYNKPVYGMFIAVKIDTNTAETFRHGIWYAKGDVQQRLIILPISLEQFQIFFENLFKTNQAKPEKLVELIKSCVDKRDEMEAPAWKSYIEGTVRRLGAYVQHLTPYMSNDQFNGYTSSTDSNNNDGNNE